MYFCHPGSRSHCPLPLLFVLANPDSTGLYSWLEVCVIYKFAEDCRKSKLVSICVWSHSQELPFGESLGKCNKKALQRRYI